MKVGKAHAQQQARAQQHGGAFGARKHKQGQSREQQGRVQNYMLAMPVKQAAAMGPREQGRPGVTQKENAGRARESVLRGKGRQECLYAAIAWAYYKSHQREAHHTRINIAVQAEGRARRLAHGRQVAQKAENSQADQADARVEQHEGVVSVPEGKKDAQKWPKSQSQCGTHGKKAYAQTMKTHRNHIGHNGSCGGSGHAYAKTGRKALHKKHGQRIHQEQAANACGKQQQACKQAGFAPKGGELVA